MPFYIYSLKYSLLSISKVFVCKHKKEKRRRTEQNTALFKASICLKNLLKGFFKSAMVDFTEFYVSIDILVSNKKAK